MRIAICDDEAICLSQVTVVADEYKKIKESALMLFPIPKICWRQPRRSAATTFTFLT